VKGLFNALPAGLFAGNAAADTLADVREAPGIYTDLATGTITPTDCRTPLQYAEALQSSSFWNHHAHR
ncbi:MAG: hypothetical protein ACR2PF_10125, partial [Rhizobiaceae bacterium]